MLTFSVFAVGCTNTEQTAGDAEEKQSENNNSNDEAKDDEKVTITIAGGAVGNEYELTKKGAEMYEKEHPNVNVKVLDTPDLADDRLGLYLQFLEAKSSKVDLYQLDVIWPGDLGEHFVDLNKYGAKKVTDKHFEHIIKNNTVNGELKAMPWFTDGGIFYYRTDLLKKYNLDVPKTWDELEKAAKKIQKGEREAGNPDFFGFVFQGNSYEGLTCDAIEWLYSNNAGKIISDDKKITVNNENAVEILNKIKGFVGTISPEGVTGMGEEDARNIWQAGNAAFMRNWPYAYGLGNSEDSAIKGKFDVAPLPHGKGSPASCLGGWQLGVSKYSEHKEIAADVALFMTSEKVQKMRAVEGSFNPTIPSLYEDEEILEANPFMGELKDMFVNGVARPSAATSPNYAETSELFYKAVHSIITGEEKAEDALEVLELDLQDATGFETGEPTKSN
ncbi:MAG: ABC transporter substrate-binding protein [Firmicutes bacterium]|nr:ABC transporter substrate-binding protein [Bacillota bacterium]